MTITMPIAKARVKLTRLPKELRQEDTVSVTSRGKPVLAVMPWELYETIVETLEMMGDADLMKSVRQGIREYKLGKMVPWEEAKKQLAL